MIALSKHISLSALNEAKQAIEKANKAYELALRSHVEEYYQDTVSLEVRTQMVAESLADTPKRQPQTDVAPTEVEVLEKILEDFC